MSKPLRIAVFGTGYWAQFQIAAWQAIGAQVVAAWNRTRKKPLPQHNGFPSLRCLTRRSRLLLLVILTSPISLRTWARTNRWSLWPHSIKRMSSVKPMASDYPSCQRMVEACRKVDVWYAVHENFRYQPQFAPVKQWLDGGALGTHCMRMCNCAPRPDIISKQPVLAPDGSHGAARHGAAYF